MKEINRKQWLSSTLSKVMLVFGASALISKSASANVLDGSAQQDFDDVQQKFDELNANYMGVMNSLKQLGDALSAEIRQREILSKHSPSIGTVIAFAGPQNKIPDGWLLCDGTSVLRSKYPELGNVIDNYWGGQPGANDIVLPDLRGRFLRGVDHIRDGRRSGNDPGISERSANGKGDNFDVGSMQDEAFQKHDHPAKDSGHHHAIAGQSWGLFGLGNQHYALGKYVPEAGDMHGNQQFTEDGSANITVESSGGKETRPKNAYVYFIIKAE